MVFQYQIILEKNSVQQLRESLCSDDLTAEVDSGDWGRWGGRGWVTARIK